MSVNNLYTVYFRPGDSVDEDEFNSHLDEHIHDVLDVEGFLACRRYRLRLTKGEEYPSQFTYLNLYEVRGTGEELYAALQVPVQGRGHPEWWSDVARSAGYAGLIEGELNPTDLAGLFVVYTTPSEGTPSAEYEQWYGDHASANVRASSHLDRVSRYRVGSLTYTQSGAVYPEHLAVYGLSGTAEEMLAETHAAQSRGEVSSTDDLRVFASFEATAIGDRALA